MSASGGAPSHLSQSASLPRIVHWRRERKDGSVDFHFECGGERMKGNVKPAADADGLQALFEQHVGVKLPAPNWKGTIA